LSSQQDETSPTQPAPTAADRHIWEFRWVRDLAILFVIVLLLALAYSIRSITAPIVVGFALAYVFNPLVNWASRWRRVPRAASTVAVMLAVILVVVGVGAYVREKLDTQVRDMVADVSKSISNSQAVQKLWLDFNATVAEFAESSKQIDSDKLKPLLDEMNELNLASVAKFLLSSLDLGVGAVGSLVSTATSLVLMMVIVAFCFFYFSWKFPSITGWFKPLIPAAQRQRTLEIIGMMDQSVAAFVRGRLIQSLVMGLLLSFGWEWTGVPYWLLLGMGCGLLNLVPYAAVAGCLVAVGLTCVHALAGADSEAAFSWSVVIWPLGVYLIVQGIDGWLVEPLVQGKATDLDPLSVLLVVFVGGAIAGLLGMLLAIPTAACAKILLREVILPRWRTYADSGD
jgi:predicted PurR-regulated permease PerM